MGLHIGGGGVVTSRRYKANLCDGKGAGSNADTFI